MIKKIFSVPITYNNLEVEINSHAKLYDFIKKDNDITILSENKDIDTSKLGKQKLSIKVKNGSKKQTISFEIKVIDTTKPVISINEKNLTTNIGKSIDLLENVTASDNSKEQLEIKVLGDYSFDKEGKYTLQYYAKDSSGNETLEDFTLKVISLESAPVSYTEYQDLNDGDYTTSNGYTLTIKDGVAYVDGYVIVNKTYALPSSYKPINPYSGEVSSESCISCIDKETMEAFKEMEADARSIGLNLYISSGYRSYTTQKRLFQNYSAKDGEVAADKYSARAGHSEHQTGYCFDLNTIDDSFANTNEGKWVDSNAYLYGFIIRFPKGKEEITGYQYESWHLRYVGKGLAKKLYNNGNWITLEEYYGLTSNYK